MEGRIRPINSVDIIGVNIIPGEYLQALYNPAFDTLMLLVGTCNRPVNITLYRNGIWAQKDTRKYINNRPVQ